jgi:transposase InsO family protein
MLAEQPNARLTRVLRHLGLRPSAWYRRPVAPEAARRRGPKRKPVPAPLAAAITANAKTFPWWGYKRIAVVCRRQGFAVTNRQAYRVMGENGLLHKPVPRAAELYQTAKLFELLPRRPNDLWQADVTYIHIPGYGWWYAVTVIDYYSRYLLAAQLTPSTSAAAVAAAIDAAKAHAEAIHGPLTRPPFLVTDNGPSFLAKRFRAHLGQDFSHVRIRYRTPTQLGLLERFHQTLKTEEVYWRLYDNPGHCRDCLAAFQERYNTVRPHWALRPAPGADPLTPHQVYAGGAAVIIPRWQHWARAAKKRLDDMLAADAQNLAA